MIRTASDNGQRHAGLHVDGVSKTFRKTQALRDVTLDAAPGEIVAVTGPSGAGKTTLARMIAGLSTPDGGAISLGGRVVDALAPQARNVAMMFESYALYPQMTVRENVAFPLSAPGREGALTAEEITARIDELFELTELAPLAGRMPNELSGGQKQRVALCRTLVQSPSMFVFDEPISHLDAKLRHALRGALRQRLKARDVPSLWCTPDGIEALSVADRVAVLIAGELRQFATPDMVFSNPGHVQVARLIGDPAMNLLTGALRSKQDALYFEHDAMRLRLPAKTRARLTRAKAGPHVVLGIRASDISIAARKGSDGGAGEIYTIEPFGKYSIVTVILGADRIKAKMPGSINRRIQDKVALKFDSKEFSVFDAQTGYAI